MASDSAPAVSQSLGESGPTQRGSEQHDREMLCRRDDRGPIRERRECQAGRQPRYPDRGGAHQGQAHRTLGGWNVSHPLPPAVPP